MSIRKLLGLNGTGISDDEIMAKLVDAQKRNLDEVEFNIDGKTVKISLPHIAFDKDADD